MAKSRTNKRKKKSRRRGPETALVVSDRRAHEGLLAALARDLGGGGKGAGSDAQNLMYKAWESQGPKRVDLALKALWIDPDCADAYVLLAEENASSLNEARDLLEKGVTAGERSLGPTLFEEDAGHFWGIVETRPYMRARSGLAQTLWALGDRDGAIGHYQELLRLNPNDNQGIRWLLMPCLLETRRDADAERLLAEHAEDASAMWAYSAALLAFRREGDSAEARKRLGEALESNPHVPAFLLRKKRIPAAPPAMFGLGDESEAVTYAFENAAPWASTPGALDWLADRTARSREAT